MARPRKLVSLNKKHFTAKELKDREEVEKKTRDLSGELFEVNGLDPQDLEIYNVLKQFFNKGAIIGAVDSYTVFILVKTIKRLLKVETALERAEMVSDDGEINPLFKIKEKELKAYNQLMGSLGVNAKDRHQLAQMMKNETQIKEIAAMTDEEIHAQILGGL